MVLYGLVKWKKEMEINKTAQRRHDKKDEKKLFYQQNREVNCFFQVSFFNFESAHFEFPYKYFIQVNSKFNVTTNTDLKKIKNHRKSKRKKENYHLALYTTL